MTNYSEQGYERCIVTFIDILGFRNLLKTKQADELASVVNALRRFTAGDGDHEDPPSGMDEVRLHSQAYSESVSDAVVRVRTVNTQYSDGAFVYELTDLLHAVIECLNRGILVRGGMTIGHAYVGLRGKGPIFGPAMVRAFEIEQNEAVYPRVMIDEAILAAYTEDRSLWQNSEIYGDEARLSRSFIGVSDDGSYFLDYLSAAGPGEFDLGVKGQLSFLGRHRTLIVEGLQNDESKIRRKFVWLASYHNRFITKLRADYDLTDNNSAFEAEIGLSPQAMFDSLQIEETWHGYLHRIHTVAESVEGD